MDKRKHKKQANQENHREKTPILSDYPIANREHKDCLFRRVFEKKEDLLQLYNAVNGTDYRNAEELEVNTLEDVIYLGIKNDKSFLVGGTMNLYEHQSTYNPNIPIRGLLYFARLYQQYIAARNIRLYGSTLIKLPFPQYIVFYNGTKKEPEKSYLRLTDSFETKGGEPALECVATMFNINYGYNRELMHKCRRLEEYSVFIATVRKHTEMQKDLNAAVSLAVDECVEKGVLKDLLLKCRAEVIDMVLTSFSMEEYEQTIRDESYQEGLEAGERIGIEKGEKIGIDKGEKIGIRKGLELAKKSRILKKQGLTEEEIGAKLQLSAEEVRELLKE